MNAGAVINHRMQPSRQSFFMTGSSSLLAANSTAGNTVNPRAHIPSIIANVLMVSRPQKVHG